MNARAIIKVCCCNKRWYTNGYIDVNRYMCILTKIKFNNGAEWLIFRTQVWFLDLVFVLWGFGEKMRCEVNNVQKDNKFMYRRLHWIGTNQESGWKLLCRWIRPLCGKMKSHFFSLFFPVICHSMTPQFQYKYVKNVVCVLSSSEILWLFLTLTVPIRVCGAE